MLILFDGWNDMLFSNHYNKQSIQNKRKTSANNRNNMQNRQDYDDA